MSLDTGRTIYNFVSTSNKYEKIFDNYHDEEKEIYIGICRDNIGNSLGEDNPSVLFCAKCVKYLNDFVEDKHPSLYRDDACNYMFYDLIHTNKSNDGIIKFYQMFIESDEQLNICSDYMKDFSKDIYKNIQKLIALHESLKKLENPSDPGSPQHCTDAKSFYESHKSHLEQFCMVDSDAFCEELEKFKPRYDSCISMITCEGLQKTLLSTKKNNLVGFIVFPVFIMAVISFILFILYKYTSYASWLRPQKGKNCLRDNLDEEINNVIYTSEMSSTNLKNRPYNIAYHSEGY
ncbi:PIR Superfamily Protein [Plasmodium ovale wallikeri]|uniref:PIR Superfamily Protein n=1 Tax=Plasmodium ovale wallikeri TaxID=864142 RepID=A0A1A9AS79_PLAOA|nr:PIR Superfamily Protein [Plasmodium ovale wallikeri]